MCCNEQIYKYSSGNYGLNTYINPQTTKSWEENEGNMAICVLAVADGEHTRNRRRREAPSHQLMGVDRH
jgi:hypothetical protein